MGLQGRLQSDCKEGYSPTARKATVRLQGRLQSDCKEGYSLTVFSYNLGCINCTDTITSIVLRAFKWIIVPQTAFYVLALTFRLSITSPKFTAFLFVSQILGSPQLLKLAIYTIPLSEIKGISLALSQGLIQF